MLIIITLMELLCGKHHRNGLMKMVALIVEMTAQIIVI